MTKKQVKAARQWIKAHNGELVLSLVFGLSILADAKPWVLLTMGTITLLVFIVRQRLRDWRRIEAEGSNCEEAETGL
ncbi:hypothetical protein LJC60_00960 [Ruminococcaceae bacterium OttesenSCG-928-D13]|nr:hypothetical protein [Ruminococcaceae bacterium OttesenSCG-928-D13]